MAVSLQKGAKISLAKAAESAGVAGGGLNKMFCGLGWDIKRFDGGSDFDLDASVFMCDATGKVVKEEDFIFYGNKIAAGIQHMGDNRTGAGDGDDEVINLEMPLIDQRIEKLVFAVTIHDAAARGQNFGGIENAYIRLVDTTTGVELLKYDLTEDYSIETALVVGELYRHNGEWKFSAIGSGFQGGLSALCASYGLDTD